MTADRPRIGITLDRTETRLQVGHRVPEHVAAAGGLPILLPQEPRLVPELLALCDGIILTGGDDPYTEAWGEPTHPKATPVHPQRQAFELALLDAVSPALPVLGICLGMQYMGLCAGGRLNQHLPDTHDTASEHWDQQTHTVWGEIGGGTVHSHHRQALDDAGRLDVIALAPDGVIEAVRDPARAFYVGVQWHPERTDDEALGAALFKQLVDAARDRNHAGARV